MAASLPFQPRWREAMLSGRKVCTSRSRRFGRPGDTFQAFGTGFELRAIERLPLLHVKDHLYLQEGCESPDEFQRAWNELHPRRGFVPEQPVYVHWFVRKAVKEEDRSVSP
jgi:hypothetical protein